MKISKKSWHYRLLKRIGAIENSWERENLCKYFWKTVFFAVIVPPIFTIVAGILLMPFWWWLVMTEVDAVVLPALIGMIDIGILSGFWAKYRDHLRDIGKLPKKVYKPTVYKEPSLFNKWLHAKHRQICPYLEFVDD